MKKLILFLAFAGLFDFVVKAQDATVFPRCFTTEYHNEEVLKNPQILQNQKDLEEFTKQFIQDQSVQRSSNALPYIIPVVFHVLHDYGNENVSDAVIIEAVRLMNTDFRKTNPDTISIVPAFQAIAADSEIEFRLATIDPNGNCTNGIEHLPTLKTYSANEQSKTDPNWVIWPNSKYLNIWVAHTLENNGAAAYAYYPGTAPDTRDGIMCQYTYVNNFNNTLTHELGHSLNLAHVWGSTNEPGVQCGDDGVNDTPITKGFNQGTNCPLNAAICNPPIIENVQNYMEYSYCDNMFTQGQKVRMHAALNSGLSHRNNLWTTPNLIATGTDGSPTQICVPKADFKIGTTNACANDSIQFTDQSWRGSATNWSWSFPGASTPTSNSQNPLIVYTAAGIYNASLTVSNASGSDSITKNAIIRVSGNTAHVIPFVESFEDTSSFPGVDGWLENPSNDLITWQRVTNAASGGVSSIKINNYTNTIGAIDEWVTPSLDFSNINFPVTISFKLSHAQRNSATTDELKLFYSLNCGQTWSSTSYSKIGPSLSTAGFVTSNFTPNSPSQWRQETVIVNAVKLKPNVRFKFRNTSDHGNNVYIDEINMTGMIVGIDEAEELQTGFTLYPNPTSGTTTLEFMLTKSNNVKVEVKDILGRTIHTVLNDNLNAGMHENKIPALPSGIYLIDLTVNNKHHIRKLVVS